MKVNTVLLVMIGFIITAISIFNTSEELDDESSAMLSLIDLTDMYVNGYIARQCLDEFAENNEDVPFNASDIREFAKKAVFVCDIVPITNTVKVFTVGAETVAIPLKQVLPYEVVKRTVLDQSSRLTCTDYVNTFNNICPKTLFPAEKR